MMNVYCLYFPNGKRYVGVEREHGRRIRDHRNMMTTKRRRGRPQVVDLAVRKHGWENCRWRYLATNCSDEDGWGLEMTFIRLFNTQDPEWGYNVSAGGRNASFGTKRTPEMRAHHSAVMRARGFVPNAGNFQRGNRPHHTGTKGKMRAWNKGLKTPPETLRKLSEARKGRVSWNKGIRPSAETIAKQLATKRARGIISSASASGLATGELWNDSGTVKIV